ncbi:GIY-YIG nuclease family protein [Paenibacillus larvae]
MSRINKEQRAELQQAYKELKKRAAVYQIRNTMNGKLFIDSTLNLKTLNGEKFMLNMGTHNNRSLQQEWKEFGEDAFVFEVLEELKKPENEYVDIKDELKKLKDKWLGQVQPYGEKGYN